MTQEDFKGAGGTGWRPVQVVRLQEQVSALEAEIKQLRTERDKYKGTLRYLVGEGSTVARRALEGK